MNLISRPVLMLNSSYEVLTYISARRALTLIVKGSAVIEDAADIMVYPDIPLPETIRLTEYRKIKHKNPQVTRKNILIRDDYTCMYCGKKFQSQELTMDHIHPKSRGGKNTFDNLVAACHVCNRRKDNRTPEEAGMTLLKRPKPLNIHTPKFLARSVGAHNKTWQKYLYYENSTPQEG